MFSLYKLFSFKESFNMWVSNMDFFEDPTLPALGIFVRSKVPTKGSRFLFVRWGEKRFTPREWIETHGVSWEGTNEK